MKDYESHISTETMPNDSKPPVTHVSPFAYQNNLEAQQHSPEQFGNPRLSDFAGRALQLLEVAPSTSVAEWEVEGHVMNADQGNGLSAIDNNYEINNGVQQWPSRPQAKTEEPTDDSEWISQNAADRRLSIPGHTFHDMEVGKAVFPQFDGGKFVGTSPLPLCDGYHEIVGDPSSDEGKGPPKKKRRPRADKKKGKTKAAPPPPQDASPPCGQNADPPSLQDTSLGGPSSLVDPSLLDSMTEQGALAILEVGKPRPRVDSLHTGVPGGNSQYTQEQELYRDMLWENILEQWILGSPHIRPVGMDHIHQELYKTNQDIPLLPRDVWFLVVLNEEQKASLAAALTSVAYHIRYQPPNTALFRQSWEAMIVFSIHIAQVDSVIAEYQDGRPCPYDRAAIDNALVVGIIDSIPNFVDRTWSWHLVDFEFDNDIHPMFEKLTPEQRWWFSRYHNAAHEPVPDVSELSTEGVGPYSGTFNYARGVPYVPTELLHITGIEPTFRLSLYQGFMRNARYMLLADPESQSFKTYWDELVAESARCWNTDCAHFGAEMAHS